MENDPTGEPIGRSEQPDLLGYLLGALDAEEQDSIQAQLDSDADLREALALIEDNQVLPPRMSPDTPFPAGLGRRTLEFVTKATGGLPPPEPKVGLSEPTLHEINSVAVRSRRFGWLEFAVSTVACSIFAVVLIPSIYNARFEANVTECLSNMRNVGFAFRNYMEDHHGEGPVIPRSGKEAFAGYYAPKFFEGGYVDDPAVFSCPGSSRTRPTISHFPSLAEVNHASGKVLEDLKERAGGDFCWPLGFLDINGELRGPQLGIDGARLLMSDITKNSGFMNRSANHGGGVTNVLFDDCHAETVRAECPLLHKATFQNDVSMVAAGVSIKDISLGPSQAAPIPFLYKAWPEIRSTGL